MGEPIVAIRTAEAPTVLNPPLLPMEQVGPKGWIRTMLIFKLAEDYNLKELSGLLRTGFKNFKSITPIAGCEAVPLEGKQAGLLQFREYGDEIDDFVIKDLRTDADLPSYAELEARGFPASAMDVNRLCLRGKTGEWPKAGDRLNVVMAQANFIKGGLILNTLIFHAYADGTTSYKFTEILAQEIRRAQNLPIDSPAEIPVEDRAKLMKPYLTSDTLGQPENHREYVVVPFTPESMPPKLLANNHIGHVFHFSPAKIAALKALAAPANAKLLKAEADSVPFVTTNDVLTALIWRSVMSAQYPQPIAEEAAQRPSLIGIALDVRRRASVPIHKHTLGNILGFATAELDLTDLITKASLADLAILIRRGVAKTEKSYVDSLTTLVDSLEDVNRLVPNMFLDMPGNHILISSWAEFPFYDIPWGPAFGDKIQSVRVPDCGICHAFQVRLPDNPANPGAELFVCTFAPDMERLLADPLWTEFAGTPEDN